MLRRLGFRWSIACAVLIALGVACGGDAVPSADPTTPVARPSSTAELSIEEPAPGAVVRGSTVSLRVRLEGATLVDFTSTNLEPDEGHLHVLLDGRLISMTSGLEQEIPDVATGAHVLRVEFVANDHAPFDPRVVQGTTFEVA